MESDQAGSSPDEAARSGAGENGFGKHASGKNARGENARGENASEKERSAGDAPASSEPPAGRALALKLWTVLSRASSAVADHSVADIRRHDLTPGEFGTLEALYHRGPLLLGELQEKILVSSGGITYLVDRLTDRGLVERQPCPEDRRASYAVLTPEGKALMERIFPAHARVIERAVSGLSDDEKRRAVRLLKKVGHRAAELDPGRRSQLDRAAGPEQEGADASDAVRSDAQD